MELGITIGIGIILLLLGIWGLRRGVKAGVMSLIGTLLAVELVDLWHDTWGELLQKWVGGESTQTWEYGAAVAVFVAVVLLVGYGSSMLLSPAQVQKKTLADRVVGGLLGILNGALIISYLLRYTVSLLESEPLNEAIFSSTTSLFLYQWLPWFLLATILMLFLAILVRAIRFVLAARSAMIEAKLARQETTKNRPTSSGKKDKGSKGSASYSSSSSSAKVDEKIEQRLREEG